MSMKTKESNFNAQRTLYADSSVGKIVISPKIYHKLQLQRGFKLNGTNINQKIDQVEQCTMVGMPCNVDLGKEDYLNNQVIYDR